MVFWKERSTDPVRPATAGNSIPNFHSLHLVADRHDIARSIR
jgi:hypothetical protein